MAASEQTATEFITHLSGNGGSITSGATSMLVADALPAGLSTPFRAVIYASGAVTGEIVRVTGVSTLTWTVVRGQETTLGAPAASGHNDGDSVAVVLTATGLPKVLIDGTAASTSAVGDAATAGSVGLASDSGHVHGREAFVVPSIALGSSAVAGSALTPIRSDATIVAFDATAPTTSAPGDVAATGSGGTAAYRSHVHGREAYGAAGDIASINNSAAGAGAVGKVADAGHTHIGQPMAFWGDGSDGTVTISGTTTLSRDMYYGTLTVNGSQFLNTAGFRVFVQNTLTNAGTIRPASPGNGGNGGAAGGAMATGWFQSSAGGSSVIATGGNAGANGGDNYGGAGKAGGNGSVHNGAAGGSASTPTYDTRRGPFGLRLTDLANIPTLGGTLQENFYEGGTGGGGGGTDGVNVGGGGGGGAGGVAIAARIFVMSGTVAAAGGNGGSPTAGNCGGGGGGGGGFVVIHSTSASNGTVTATGGTHGNLHGTGTNGTDGANGTTLWVQWAA